MSTSNMSTAPEFPTGEEQNPGWQNCGTHNTINQVLIREATLETCSGALYDIANTLKKAKDNIRSAEKWHGRISKIDGGRAECRIVVGFLGASGSGKSSLINAILKEEDLLMVNDETACTAVCVEIAWNSDEEPNNAYKAVVERITRSEWKTELERLFEDLKERASEEEAADGELDIERDFRITAGFQKLHCVYPHIETEEAILSHTIEELLNHPNIAGLLGKKTKFMMGDRAKFAAKSRRYMDSRKLKTANGVFIGQWPLIKQVRLLVTAPILKNGIVLVDLPGSMDTNVARGAIAMNYQRKLSITCVVAPATRAATDKPAQDLLGKITMRTMQLDNKFSTDNLCYIVTKTDSSMDNVPRYISQHPNVQKDLRVEDEAERRTKEKLVRVKDFIAEKRSNQAASTEVIASLNKRLKSAFASLKKAGYDAHTPLQKRKYEWNDVHSEFSGGFQTTPTQEELQKEIHTLQEELKDVQVGQGKDAIALGNAIEKMEQLNIALTQFASKKKAFCVKNRNKVIANELRKDYNATLSQMDLGDNSKPLQVFGVSSLAFNGFQEDCNPVPGFLKVEDTGVPALKDWLIETTLPTRDRNALQYLEEVVRLEMAMGPWLGTPPGFKLAQSLKDMITCLYDDSHDVLIKAIEDASSRAISTCHNIVEAQLISMLPEVEDAATRDAESTVKKWGKLHWATHRMTNRFVGDYCSKKTHHNWNAELADLYLVHCVNQWAETIHHRLPKVQGSYDEEVSKALRVFLEDIEKKTKQESPALGAALKQWKETSLKVTPAFEKHSSSVFDVTMQEASRDAHRRATPQIQQVWQEVYDNCGKQSGTGHFKRNREAHIAFVQQTARKMYKGCTKAISNAFDALWKSSPAQFMGGATTILEEIREDFEDMLIAHTLPSGADYNQAHIKAKLQQDILQRFAKMKEGDGWTRTNEDTPSSDEESESDDESINVEDLLDGIKEESNLDDDENDEEDEEDEEDYSGGED